MNIPERMREYADSANNFNIEDIMMEARKRPEEIKLCIRIDDATRIAEEAVKDAYKQGQIDLVNNIAQDMFNACALSFGLEYVGELKKQVSDPQPPFEEEG